MHCYIFPQILYKPETKCRNEQITPSLLCNCSGLIYKKKKKSSASFPTITVSVPIWFYFSKQKTSCSTFQQQYAAYSLEKN